MQLTPFCETKTPAWLEGKRINEIAFCDAFLARHPMKCIGGQLFDIDGRIGNEDRIRREILDDIAPYLTSGVAKRTTQLLDAIRLRCYAPVPPVQTDRIHFQNGTYFLDDGFRPVKEFCLNRLPVNYDPDAPAPARWLRFLQELLNDADIPTLQEFMGYSLLPTTKGQKMMIVIGRGGEGKSRIGLVLRALLGDSMNTGSISKVETDRFARADLEYKLLMVDDDMKLEALPQTNNIKSLVTLEGKTDLERKCRQSTQGFLYVRFLCFGNGNLSSLYDRSYGFFRRQIVLTVRDREADRIDDPFLIEKLRAETGGILLWCLEGLHRLLQNDYRFTVSDQAKQNLETAMQESNSVIEFMRDGGYVRFAPDAAASSKKLCGAYRRWCEENCEKPLSDKSFLTYLRQNETAYEIRYSNNLPIGGRTARGYRGVEVVAETDACGSLWRELPDGKDGQEGNPFPAF